MYSPGFKKTLTKWDDPQASPPTGKIQGGEPGWNKVNRPILPPFVVIIHHGLEQ